MGKSQNKLKKMMCTTVKINSNDQDLILYVQHQQHAPRTCTCINKYIQWSRICDELMNPQPSSPEVVL